MQVSVLGPLLVAEAGRPVAVGGARLRALLVRLAADPGRWVGAGLLADALWPDEPPADQANALQSLVSRLRRALPRPALVESGPAGYRLAIGPLDVDASRFEADLARARHTLGAVDGGGIRAALAMWRGPALVDVPDLPFATAWAARLEELRLGAIEDAVEAALTGGIDLHAADVVLELEEVVAGHPLRERPHGQLIRLLAATGRQAEALAVYENLRARLADQLGVDPAAELQALHLALLRGEPLPGAVAAGPRRRPRTNLRPSLTSFVGREDDVRAVRELLHRSRLVTLTGAGGSGKTRLSVEVVSDVEGTGTEGVWQVELAPVTDPGDLAVTALGAIGLRDTTVVDTRQAAHRDPLNRLVEAIDEHDMVLLLDNCEHVIDAAAALAETLLGRCPRLSILATSREPLGIMGESLWPVKPLALSGDSGRPAALQLFADRAALVRPGFELDAEHEPVVAEICRRLDGLPLAIELAAARLRTLPLDTVARRLSDRFRLLSGGNRTALPRHQTLRAVVAWSWDLLTDAERSLAEQLSVFPGGTAVEAAQALPGADPAGTPELLDALADKSLLSVTPETEPRYRMLETIREFGTERLAERHEIDSTRAAFAKYFRDLVEQAEPRLRAAHQLTWLNRLDLEHDNILAAIRYATDAGDAGTAVRLAAGMGWYWTLLGQHEEAASWLEPVLAMTGEMPREPYLVARMIYTLSHSFGRGALPERHELDELRQLAASIELDGMPPLITLVEPAIGMLSDDLPAVQAAVERNLAHPDPWARAMLLEFMAISAENAGELDVVRKVLPQALEGFRRIGDRWGLATTLGTSANLLGLDGDDAAAIDALDEAQRLMSELRARDDEQYTMIRIAMLRARNGDLAAAREIVDRAMDLAVASGALHSEAFAQAAYGQLARMEGDLAGARRWLEQALAFLPRMPTMPPQVGATVRIGLIQLELQDGDVDAAREHVAPMTAAAEASRDMPVAAMGADILAGLAAASGEREVAARLLGAGVALRGGEDLGEPVTRALIATLRDELGDEAFEQQRAAGAALDRDAALALMHAQSS